MEMSCDRAEGIAFGDGVIGSADSRDGRIIRVRNVRLRVGGGVAGRGAGIFRRYRVSGLKLRLSSGGGIRLIGFCAGLVLAAALQKQSEQADAVNGEHEKDCDLYPGATLIFLLQKGAQWR